MAKISIDPAKTKPCVTRMDDVARNLKELSGTLDDIRGNLGYKIAGREQIAARLRDVSGQVVREETAVRSMRDGLEQIVNQYLKTENTTLGFVTPNVSTAQQDNGQSGITDTGLGKLVQDIFSVMRWPNGLKWLPSLSTSGGGNGVLSYFEKALQSVKDEKDLLSMIKGYLGSASTYGGNKEAGVLKNLISYVENLAKFYTGDKKGLTGAKDFCNLTTSSVNLWKGAYDYFRNKYSGMTTGFFGDVANRRVSALGFGSSIVGFMGSLASASDFDGKKWQSIVAGYIDSGKDVISIFRSGYQLKHLSDVKNPLLTKDGVWTPLSVYSALGESALAVVSQGFKSHEKYYADGKWDLGDTGATGIDISLAGIYAIGHSLSFGLDDVVYGWIDKATGGSGTSDMSYLEQSMEGYKIAGQWIADKAVEKYNAAKEFFSNLRLW